MLNKNHYCLKGKCILGHAVLSELSSSKSVTDLPFPSKDLFNEESNLEHKEKRLLTTCFVEPKLTIRDQLVNTQSAKI